MIYRIGGEPGEGNRRSKRSLEDEDISVTRDWDESKDWFGPASKLGSALLTSALDGHKVGPSED